MRGSLKMRGVISPEHQLRVCLAWLSPCRGTRPEQRGAEQLSVLGHTEGGGGQSLFARCRRWEEKGL